MTWDRLHQSHDLRSPARIITWPGIAWPNYMTWGCLPQSHDLRSPAPITWHKIACPNHLRDQELCENRDGRPRLSILMSLMVLVDVKQHWNMHTHWSQFVPNNYVNRHPRTWSSTSSSSSCPNHMTWDHLPQALIALLTWDRLHQSHDLRSPASSTDSPADLRSRRWNHWQVKPRWNHRQVKTVSLY